MASLLGTGDDAVSVGSDAEYVLFDADADGGAALAYVVKNTHATIGLKVRVYSMHMTTSHFAMLDAGDKETFIDHGGIRKITAKAASSTGTVRGYVKAK